MADVFEQDFNACLEIMRSAGEWRATNSVYSKFWDPALITPEMYLEEFYEDQPWVLRRDGVAIAAATLSEPERRKNIGSWKDELGEAYASDSALHLDNLAVRGDLIGQGVIVALLKAIEQRARQTEVNRLRLDCDEALVKLKEYYEQNGFKTVTTKDVGHRISVFMERIVAA